MPEKEEKRKLIDAIETLEEMEQLERFNGTTKEKIVDNWYAMKNRLLEAINKDEDKKD